MVVKQADIEPEVAINAKFDAEWEQLDRKLEDEQLQAERSQPLMRSDDPLFRQQSVFTQQSILKQEVKPAQAESVGEPLFQSACLKILIPEGSALKEAAAKRVVRVEQAGEQHQVSWARSVDGKLEVSGTLQIKEIINVLAAEDARAFRSKVLSARKAGYVQDVFELIQTGILDEMKPKQLIQSQASVVFFTATQVLCFDFQNEKDEFEGFCGILV